MDKGNGRVIYVGSIPYDQTEEQVLEIFRSVGPVAKFRLVFDKDTGKSKGFGFVEYLDAETAASAVRNLNNFPIGNRSLRVDFSHEASMGPYIFTSKGKSGTEIQMPSLPQGTALPRGAQAAETISNIVNGFPQDQKIQMITDLKSIVDSNQPMAVELLRTCPQLSYAVVQSMLALGIVNPQIIGTIVDSKAAVTGQASPPPQQQPGVVPQKADEQQAALIQQVVMLTEEQINALPPDQRDAIKLLREQVRTGQIQM
jgi:cleavage stimulation factor subunit 2